ncbi:MAG: hypothetical protein A2V88_11320 [Elusimicrobia bacterium RBG_16_66_12]|nr:MAG: hypothetical protein A2V88_11320 [Elusimicrobia bacterium RBG_16_66_12]
MDEKKTMHASADIRVVKCADGLHYSFEMLEYIYAGLHETCADMTTDKKSLIPALWRCWSFVDLVHRIREIAQALPGLSKKDANLMEFLAASALAEDFRHYIQHLRKELSKREVDKFPVWGSLAWVDKADPACCHTVMLGARLENASYASAVFDRFEKRWVSKVSLSIGGRSFHFDPVFQACQKFRAFIMPQTAAIYARGYQISLDPPVITMRIANEGEYWGRAQLDQPL